MNYVRILLLRHCAVGKQTKTCFQILHNKLTSVVFQTCISKFKKDRDLVLTPAYFKGSIDQSLRGVFGEIGGQTEVDIFKLDTESHRAIVRVPEDFYVKTRAAITLISKFQDIPCHFHVKKASTVLLHLISSHTEF